MNKQKLPDYEGFVKHIEAWDDAGIPWGLSDLVTLAEMYNTPIPSYKEIDGVVQGIEFPKDEKGVLKPLDNGSDNTDNHH